MMLHFNIRILALWNKLHKIVRRCYWYTLLLRSIELYFIYKEDLTTNLPRCWYNCAASTTLLVRFYPDTCLLRSYYTCFEHVQNKRVRSVVLPDHKDTTWTLLRLWRPNKASTTIRHDRGGGVKQYQKHVYSKLIIKIFCNPIYMHIMFFEQFN